MIGIRQYPHWNQKDNLVLKSTNRWVLVTIITAFEALEEERLGMTRNSIWRLANVSSAASVADDEAAESVRQTLETNNLADVFKEFVDNEGTGNKRPKPGMVVKLVSTGFIALFTPKTIFPRQVLFYKPNLLPTMIAH